MNKLYVRCKEKVKEKIRQTDSYSDEEVREVIQSIIAAEHHRHWFSLRKRVILGKRIFDALRGLDVLQPLMDDEAVTDIMVNGESHIYYEKNGHMIRYSEHFEDKRRLEDLIQQIVGQVNRSVNEANPIVDARLPDGSRVHAVLSPIALNGPVLTIRKFRKEAICIEELIEWGTLTSEIAAFLEKAVKGKKNIFVCGGTSSGKTTLLNVLSNFIPPEERIITIEDAAELRLAQLENVITMETRQASGGKTNSVTMADLIKASLRMNPDRIIVGEVRGAEALDMLQAMNTGHEGSLSTGHANSCRDMLMRIETMVLMGHALPLEAIRQQIASAIDLLIFVERNREGKRELTEIVEVDGYEEGQINTRIVFKKETN